jgi:predicted RNA-binding Zn-ribbon protein involved in translation (DUF1610 family)
MSTALRGGKVKGRKDHTCTLCRRSIAKGDEHWAWVGVDCGKARTWRAHEVCMEVTSSWDEDDWECSFWVDFRQELKEYLAAKSPADTGTGGETG